MMVSYTSMAAFTTWRACSFKEVLPAALVREIKDTNHRSRLQIIDQGYKSEIKVTNQRSRLQIIDHAHKS